MKKHFLILILYNTVVARFIKMAFLYFCLILFSSFPLIFGFSFPYEYLTPPDYVTPDILVTSNIHTLTLNNIHHQLNSNHYIFYEENTLPLPYQPLLHNYRLHRNNSETIITFLKTHQHTDICGYVSFLKLLLHFNTFKTFDHVKLNAFVLWKLNNLLLQEPSLYSLLKNPLINHFYMFINSPLFDKPLSDQDDYYVNDNCRYILTYLYILQTYNKDDITLQNYISIFTSRTFLPFLKKISTKTNIMYLTQTLLKYYAILTSILPSKYHSTYESHITSFLTHSLNVDPTEQMKHKLKKLFYFTYIHEFPQNHFSPDLYIVTTKAQILPNIYYFSFHHISISLAYNTLDHIPYSSILESIQNTVDKFNKFNNLLNRYTQNKFSLSQNNRIFIRTFDSKEDYTEYSTFWDYPSDNGGITFVNNGNLDEFQQPSSSHINVFTYFQSNPDKILNFNHELIHALCFNYYSSFMSTLETWFIEGMAEAESTNHICDNPGILSYYQNQDNTFNLTSIISSSYDQPDIVYYFGAGIYKFITTIYPLQLKNIFYNYKYFHSFLSNPHTQNQFDIWRANYVKSCKYNSNKHSSFIFHTTPRTSSTIIRTKPTTPRRINSKPIIPNFQIRLNSTIPTSTTSTTIKPIPTISTTTTFRTKSTISSSTIFKTKPTIPTSTISESISTIPTSTITESITPAQPHLTEDNIHLSSISYLQIFIPILIILLLLIIIFFIVFRKYYYIFPFTFLLKKEFSILYTQNKEKIFYKTDNVEINSDGISYIDPHLTKIPIINNIPKCLFFNKHFTKQSLTKTYSVFYNKKGQFLKYHNNNLFTDTAQYQLKNNILYSSLDIESQPLCIINPTDHFKIQIIHSDCKSKYSNIYMYNQLILANFNISKFNHDI